MYANRKLKKLYIHIRVEKGKLYTLLVRYLIFWVIITPFKCLSPQTNSAHKQIKSFYKLRYFFVQMNIKSINKKYESLIHCINS